MLKNLIKNLTPSEFQLYLQLKPVVPKEQQQDFKDAFLKFQDPAMMQHFSELYLA